MAYTAFAMMSLHYDCYFHKAEQGNAKHVLELTSSGVQEEEVVMDRCQCLTEFDAKILISKKQRVENKQLGLGLTPNLNPIPNPNPTNPNPNLSH